MWLFLFVFLFISSAVAQRTGIHTNALYLATSTPNVGMDFRLSCRFTLSATLGYNPFNLNGHMVGTDVSSNPKIRHILVMPELKYWFCQSFNGGYLGVHALAGAYNAGGIRFIPFLKKYRYKGNGVGGGISYGYQWALSRNWGLEASVGAGYIYLDYDKYVCRRCGKRAGSGKQHYFGLTKVALSFVYFIK